MAIEKFVGTEETLAPPGWKKPQHILDAIAKKKQSRAFCPTGAGGGVDNSCSSAEKSFPSAFPVRSRKYRNAIDKLASSQGRDPKKIWDRAKGFESIPAGSELDAIAAEQQAQTGKPLSSEASASYDSLIDEIGKQYEAIIESGVKIKGWKGEGEPYGDPPGSTKPDSNQMRLRVGEDGEYYFFMTEKGFGTGDATKNHPMMRETKYKTSDGEPMIANDVFRAVHDFVAHVRGGYSFSTKGEYNGMLTHASTMPETAWPALFAETFAQNAVYEKTGKFAGQNAYASKAGAKKIREELAKAGVTSRAANVKPDEGDSDEPMGYQHRKVRPWLAGDERAFCPTGEGGGVDNSCGSGGGGSGGISREMTQGIIGRVARTGGYSVRISNATEPVTGFMVARRGTSKVVKADKFFDADDGHKQIADFIQDNSALLDDDNTYLGLWHNKAAGDVYFDLVDNIADRDEAEKLGRSRNQISIWDVDNSQEIDTGGTGD